MTTENTKTKAKTSKTTDKAQEAEANNEVTDVEFKGETYEVPSALDLPWEILVAVRERDESAIMEGVLGEEQHAKWISTKPSIRDGLDFLEKVMEAVGFDDLGN